MDTVSGHSELFLAEPLTRREMEIVALLAKGFSNREIAEALTVTLSTVKWYTKQIYSKMGVNNRNAAVKQAKALGLLDDLSSRHTLPLETTKFIGREADLRQIKRDLKDPGCRLLTLIGLGGAGKTRLAIRAAREIAREEEALFKDGIHFIPLAAQQDADMLVPTIASALEFSLSGPRDPAAQLLNYLRNKEILLVLDNFEQISDGSVLISEILKTVPKIKMLVTSREALNLSEEWRFEVAGLPLPESRKTKVLDNSAIQLFVERASHVRANFSEKENATCIAHICHLVNGMPLAIELAASWIRSLSCQDIASEIETSLDFLETSLRNVPERHHSVRVIFEQSWSRLSALEKEVYSSLAIFRGGFSLAAARSVTRATPVVLTSLVDKSLVKREQSDRYQIHELLRQFAAEKLAENTEKEQDLRNRHSSFYSQLASDNQRKWGSSEQLNALELFKLEIYNLLRAWEWNITHSDNQRLEQMIFSMCEFFFWQGRLKDGVEFCRNLLERLLPLNTDTQQVNYQLLLVRCKALLWESIFITQLQNSELANGRLDAAQELLDVVDEGQQEFRFVQAHVWLHRGRTAVALGEVDRARDYLEQSNRVFLEIAEEWGAAAGWYWLGTLDWIKGNLAASRDAFKKSLSLFEKLGDRRNMASVTDALAITLRFMEQLEGVEDLHLEAISIAREINDPLRAGWMLHNLTWTHWHCGKFQAGAERGLECMNIAEDIGNDLLLAAGTGCRAGCLVHLGEYQSALTLAESAYSASLPGLLWQPFIPLTLGEAALALGEFERAIDMIGESSQIMLESRPIVASLPLASLALAKLSLGQQEEAEATLQHSLSLALETGLDIQVRRALTAGAVFLASKGLPSKAARIRKLASESPHFANSKWYDAVFSRFLDQDVDLESVGDEPDHARQTIYSAAKSLLESLSRE